MESHANPRRARLFGLIDGAACPAQIQPLLEASGMNFRSVFSGLPEEALGPASLFLAEIDDPDAQWVCELDRIDLHAPCLSLIWGRVGLDQMITHLQAFLFAEIGDGMSAMVRFFDPRNTGAVAKVWGDEILKMFIAPIDRLLYRGRYQDWQRIENDTLTGGRICKSIVIELDQSDVDALTAHTEPDEVLASVIELGLVGKERPYLARFRDFLPRYKKALQWRLEQPADRLSFCCRTYCYGLSFDHHPHIQDVLSKRMKTGESYESVIDRIPDHVWKELTQVAAPIAVDREQ